MKTKELEEVTLKDLYEVSGGETSGKENLVEAINNIYIRIKEYFNS